MFKFSKFLLLVVVFIFCGKPNTIVDEQEIINTAITYEVIIESTSGELNNVYEISETNTGKFKFGFNFFTVFGNQSYVIRGLILLLLLNKI